MRVTPGRGLMLLGIMLLAALASACGVSRASEWEKLPPNTYAPHPVFEDFYRQQGGPEMFGYAISTAYTNQMGARFQFFETVLMVHDQLTGQIRFEPLGKSLGFDRLPAAPAETGYYEDGLVVGEFYIHPAFVQLYLDFGPEMVGVPLTQAFINHSRNRIEQHFENLGMYFVLAGPEQTAALLDYGSVACEPCKAQSGPGLGNALIQTPLTDSFFYQQMERSLISVALTGEVLTGPVQDADGTTDLVFEHMVLLAENGGMRIRPVPVLLGLKDEFHYAPMGIPSMIFYDMGGGAGHNIFIAFDAYIQSHGGYAVAGRPITEVRLLDVEQKTLRQCFENLCLDYLPHLKGAEVRPARLGELYLQAGLRNYIVGEMDQQQPGNQVERHTSPFTFLVWEYPTVVDSYTPETINVMVSLENTPQPGMQVILTVTYPDGRQERIEMPPTIADGTTSFTLPPVAGENGDLIFYETCLLVQGNEQLCVEQSFMIWGNP